MQGDELILERSKVEKLLAIHFRKIMSDPNESELSRSIRSLINKDLSSSTLFEVDDIEKAMEVCNFEKSIGNDGFYGKIL